MTFHADEYKAAAGRYRAGMPYRRVGRSGLDLPAVSLGLWHNFGDDVPLERQQATLRRAFDRGVTHFDLANNYGPPYGSAERNFGTIFARDFRPYRDELVISSQGRLRHVARPVRPGRRLAQVPHGVVRPVAAADGPGLRRHLLQPPLRRDHAARGDDGRARLHRPPGQGALRRHLVVLRRAHPRGRRDPARDGHPAAHPPAVVLDAQPLDRGGPARCRRRDRPRPASPSRRWPRACSPTSTSRASPRVRVRHRASRSTRRCSPTRRSSTSGPSTGWPRRAASRWRRWRSPGRCATSGSPRCSSGRRRSSSSTTAWMPCKNLKFTADELAKIDKHAVDAGINLWKTSSDK